MQADPESITPQETRTAWYAVAAVLATLTLVKHLGAVGIGGSIGYTAAAALQLYLPFYLTRRRADQTELLGISTRGLGNELLVVALLCLLAFPLFAIGHHYYQIWFFGRTFVLNWPSGLGELILTHTLAVALPEEVFYRGYFLPMVERQLPPRQRVLGVAIGWAAVITAALFAVGHFLGEYNVLRLGPFFPALIFAWLRKRRGSLWGAVAFHAGANVIGEILYKFYPLIK